MKNRILLLMLFVASYGFSQKVNDYKAVVIPMKYDIQKTENQYRLQTITKIDLQNAGFQAFYATETMPAEFSERCDLLYIDVKKDNAFLVTKLYITFKDCFGAIIFQSAIGKSREKEYGLAYTDALNDAFMSVKALNYKYNGTKAGSKSAVVPAAPAPVATTAPAIVLPAAASTKEVNDNKTFQNISADLLYAQPTPYGYQLIDSEPKVVMKVYKTSNSSSYMAAKGSVQGVLVSKDNQWFFEYYQGDKLISEKINVKF
ncbi:MAG TPA: hypothetical protein VLR29_05020 [Flavobacterium sp.]|nr:hypothetical protein [Flavobacterium sp.]